MRKEFAVLCLLTAALAGCSSNKAKIPAYHAGDERMPEFLNGPAVVLLTNSAGYSARLETDILRANGESAPLSGTLLERNGRLVFQPDVIVKNKKQPTAGLIFIWDANLGRGWTLSEALQGYAPVEANLSATNVQKNASQGIPEMIKNQPCHRYEATISRSDGSTALYRVWEADNLRHLPIRIQSNSGGKPVTLNLSNVRFDTPSETLFNPPEGYVKYNNAVALMNELIIRQTTVGERQEATEYAAPPPPRAGTIVQPEPYR